MNKKKIVIYSILTLALLIILTCLRSTSHASEKRQTNDVLLSDKAYQACIDYGEVYCICPELIMAIIEKESGGQPDVQNGSCVGLMQISEKWHEDRIKDLGITNLKEEESNILVGCDYLFDLFEEYEDPALVLMIYHGEKDAIKNWEEGHISEYALKILRRASELEKLHGK